MRYKEALSHYLRKNYYPMKKTSQAQMLDFNDLRKTGISMFT